MTCSKILLLSWAFFVCVFAVTLDAFEKVQRQLQHTNYINNVLELEYKNSLIKISPSECRELILKSKIEGKIRRLVPGLKGQVANKLADAVFNSSLQYNIDSDLVLAIAHEESRFNSKAVSVVGAIGVMQVMPFWADKLDWVEDPNDLYLIENNIRAGTFILSEYLKLFKGNQKLALLAYNRGPGSVLMDIQKGNDPDNGYSMLVMSTHERIRKF